MVLFGDKIEQWEGMTDIDLEKHLLVATQLRDKQALICDLINKVIKERQDETK